jgi:hypothetical protein
MALETSYAVQDGAVGSPSFTFLSKLTTGFYRDILGNIGVAIAGVFAAWLSPAGVVGPVRVNVNIAAPSQALLAVNSGDVYIAVVDGAFTLPLAAAAPGAEFTIITGVASGGTGVTILRAGADVMNAKTLPAGGTAITGATTITNTGASDVVWDRMTMKSDGVAGWYAVEQSGIWA